MFYIKGLGENIRFFRKQADLTQSELAEKLNVSFQAVSGWENSQTLPDIENLCKLALVFGTSVDALLSKEISQNTVMIGVDGGGTKSEFAMFDSSGKVLKTFKLQGTNAAVCGFDSALDTFKKGIDACIAENVSVKGVFIGTAGPKLEQMEKALSEHYPKLKISIDSDGVNAYASAGADAAVICGTGSIIVMRGKRNERRVVGGWGYMLGDHGSAFNFGREAIKSAMLWEDGAGGSEIIRKYLLENTGWEGAYKGYTATTVSFIASQARAVFSAYRDGCEVAKQIVKDEMRGLATLINAACTPGSKLGAVGGIFEHFKDIVFPELREYVKEIEFIFPKLPPVFGSCVECCDRMGIERPDNFEEIFAEGYFAQKE